MTGYIAQDLQALFVVSSDWAPNSGVKSHTHEDYYHMFMVRKGPVEFTVGEETRVLSEGMGILAPPGVVHSFTNRTEEILSTYEIKFIASSPFVIRQLGTLPLFLSFDELARLLTDELVREGACQDPSSPSRVTHYLTALIDCLCRRLGRQEESGTGVIDTCGYSETSRAIVKFLEDNWKRDVPLKEIAELVRLDKHYMCSFFKKDTGMTIGACHTVIRIRKAAEMISFSEMDLSRIARESGFAGVSHFSRVFKKVVGIPPGRYRKMYPSVVITDVDSKDLGALIEKNGFIAAVFSGKKMSIRDIIENEKRKIAASCENS